MQSFKMVTEEIAESLKKFKAERSEDLREIKTLYQQLEQKQKNPFDQTIERIVKNLTFFKESEFKSTASTIKPNEITQKYDDKLRKITDEIMKLDKVIRNGCGSIVEKPPTSRLRVESGLSQRQLSQIQNQESHLAGRQLKN